MMIAFLPVTIQSILVVLVLTRNQYAKIVFLIWAIVFLIIAFGFQFVGKLLMDAAHGFSNVDFLIYIKTGTGVIIGVLMTIFTMKTVEVKIIQADEKDNEVIN